MEYGMFFDTWMWMGLGAGVVILILLFCTDFLRTDMNKKRWFDPMWLAWIGAVSYMLHNVEEYGIDLLGTHLSFVNLMTQVFGENINKWAYLGCNLPLVWVSGPLIAYLCKKKNMPGLSTGMALFMLVNGISHVGQGFNLGYNAGLLTGVFIFIPVALWTSYVVYGKKHLPWSHFGLALLIGILYHVILVLGCQLAIHGILSGIAQGIYMIIDAALFVGLLYKLNKSKYSKWN